MVSIEHILLISKSDLQEASKAFDREDISQLIEWLSFKDDSIRYQAFLLLQSRSSFYNDVYPYWNTLTATILPPLSLLLAKTK